MIDSLPQGWQKVDLKQLVSLERGSEPGTDAYCPPEAGVRFYRVGDVSGKSDNPIYTTDSDNLILAKPDDVLLVLDGCPGIVFRGLDGAISSGIRIITPLNGQLNQDFLFFGLQSLAVQQTIKSYTTGSTILHAGRAVDYIELSLPTLPEQQKIAEVLGTVDEAIGATRQVIEQTRQLKRSMLQQLLTKGIPERHTEFKDSPLGRVPAGWTTSTLQEMAVVQTGYAKNSKKKLTNSISVPYLRVANVQDGYVNLDEMKTIEIEQDRLSRYLLKSGDVLLNEGGDADKLGRGCVWMGQIQPCIHQNHVFAVRCNENLLPEFLTMQTSGERGKRYFLGASKQTTNLASINSTQLKRFQVVLPPLAEQREIVTAMARIDERLQANESFLISLEKSKESLMHKLLSGEVRVPMEPSNLEKIS